LRVRKKRSATLRRISLNKGRVGFELIASLGTDLTSNEDLEASAQILVRHVVPVAKALDAMT
jgi:hypothetical protein